MTLTLVEEAQRTSDRMTKGLVKLIVQNSPILQVMPFENIEGNAKEWREEVSIGSVGWRDVNGSFSESTGEVQRKRESLMILGGEADIDTFIIDTYSDYNNSLAPKATEIEFKTRAASNEFDRAFFEGDDLVNPSELVGLRRRLSGNQVLLQAAGGGALTLAALDQLIDSVPFPDRHLFTNRTLRRKIKTLVDAVGGSIYIPETRERFGEQPARYGGVPIHIIEEVGNADTILGFDEDPGDGVSDTASIYCLSFGMDRVHGIRNGLMRVKDFGEIPDKPVHRIRFHCYYGMRVAHPRAAARLRGITNA